MRAVSRRRWLQASAATGLLLWGKGWAQATGVHFSVAAFEADRSLRAAELALQSADVVLPGTVDAGVTGRRFLCDASLSSDGTVTGSLAHADALASMCGRVAALTAAWRLGGHGTCLEAARAQLRSWCIAPSTRMLPTLEVAAGSAWEGDLRRNALRWTLPLAEFARAASFVCAAPETPAEEATAVRAWAAELLQWFATSERGGIARDSTQADAIFWTMQAGELARFVRNDTVWRECGHRFRDRLLRQMHLDGYLPYALAGRRPYAESMLLLECLGSAAESLSTPFESLWNATLPDGRGMRSAVAWAFPYLKSRAAWPYPADVRHFSEQPLRENALLFAGRAWNRLDYVDQWKTMPPDTAVQELRREHPITQPALWAVRPPA